MNLRLPVSKATRHFDMSHYLANNKTVKLGYLFKRLKVSNIIVIKLILFDNLFFIVQKNILLKTEI